MINHELQKYIQENVLPNYLNFDKAHNLDHAEKVINNSLSIASAYDVNINKVYVIAAYHDIGLIYGRENHEKTSAQELLKDKKLKEWFSEDELVCMSEAVEDHRASNDYEPRSIYGKIVSEADRDIEYTTILKRAIQYSLNHYPDYHFEQHFQRTFDHIKDKYGEGGYLKLWLHTEQNSKNLNMLRTSIKNKEKLRDDFLILFQACTK